MGCKKYTVAPDRHMYINLSSFPANLSAIHSEGPTRPRETCAVRVAWCCTRVYFWMRRENIYLGYNFFLLASRAIPQGRNIFSSSWNGKESAKSTRSWHDSGDISMGRGRIRRLCPNAPCTCEWW